MPETAPLPQAVGPYLIRAKLGAGSMAAVYRAYDTRIQREVALKVLQLYLVGNESASKRFEREAQTLINFHHPHILPVFDYGWDGDTPYYAMPLMSGRSLADLLKSAPLPLPQVGEITRQIASALDYAHRHHIIHRDIKPKNILLDDHDTPFLADFGVALATKSPRLTSQGNFIGTVAYASPEQCRGDTVNSPADIYGLAVIVFQMVTGHPLFEAPSPLAMMMKHMNEAPPNPLAYNSRLPVGLYAVLAKALAKLPENRYETAKKFSEALDEVLGLFTPPPQADDDAWLGAAPPAAPPPPEPVYVPAPPEPPDDFFAAESFDFDDSTLPPAVEPAFEFPDDDPPVAPPPPFESPLPPLIQPLPARRARPVSGLAWGLYATIAVSIVALLTSMIILARELLGSDLDATLNSHPLDVQIHYPSDWSMAQTTTPILNGPTANMAILSDQAVPPDGPYDSAKLVIAVQQVDPLAMFKMPLRCQIEIRSGPAAAFDCMRKSGYITPKYNAFTSDHFEGAVKLPGKYPPTPAARPMVLLPLNQDTWIAVLVLHTDGYDQPDDMLNAIAQAIQPLP